MKSAFKRLERARDNAYPIKIDDSSKWVLFSDLHRGDNSFSDDFAKNRNNYLHALREYFHKGFTCVEMGDAEELWENPNFSVIFDAHKSVYRQLKQFHEANRYHKIWGNHDFCYEDPEKAREKLEFYQNPATGKKEYLFAGLVVRESIKLEHDSGLEILLLHGHQADDWNHNMHKMNKLVVKKIWKKIQIFGIADPTSPAKKNKKLKGVEKVIGKWCEKDRKRLTVMGHTHRPIIPAPGEGNLFNSGSGVHPRCVTCIEIENGEIRLVKWYTDVETDSAKRTWDQGYLTVKRKMLSPSHKLAEYLTQN